MMRVFFPAVAIAAACGFVTPASAISPFYVEDFSTPGDTSLWGGGVTGVTISNPGSGGVGGVGDGYLRLSRTSNGNLGTRSFGDVYMDDYIASGITSISLWLNDVDTSQNFNIYVSLGNTFDLWQYNIGFQPPENEWGEFVVDLTDETKWNSIGFNQPGSFETALRNTDRVLIRHDTFPGSPTGEGPVPINGQLGIDRITFLPAPGAGAILLSGAALLIRRRRGR